MVKRGCLCGYTQACEIRPSVYTPLTHIQSNACRFLFLLFTYLRFAEAASFDKKELCRSDTTPIFPQRSNSKPIASCNLLHILVDTAALLSFHVFRSARLSRKIFCNCISLRERGWGGSTIQLSLFAQICASDKNKLNLVETTDQQQCQKLQGYVNPNGVCWHTSI